MKLALCHDWLNGVRGGEKCLEAIAEIYPEADIHTLFCERRKISQALAQRRIVPSLLQRVPGIFRWYRYFLPLFPYAVRHMDLSKYDGIVSSSHCAIKGVRKAKGAWHVCYCFTPMRYAWDKFEDYFGSAGLKQTALRLLLEPIRRWDKANSADVDAFIAISHHVAGRIRKYYGREATVIYPPVNTDYYTPAAVEREDFYLVVSALVPYKRIDHAVQVFSRLNRPLIVIGEGPERERLQKMAGNNVRFLGWLRDDEIRDYYRRSRALVFPGEEDFGIVPVEMQACGGPVIAYRKGGVTETVKDGETGLFYDEMSSEALERAVTDFERRSWSAETCRVNAQKYQTSRFINEFRNFMTQFKLRKSDKHDHASQT